MGHFLPDTRIRRIDESSLALTLVACSLETEHTYEAGTRASSIPRARQPPPRWAVAAAPLAAVLRAQHQLVDGQVAAGQGHAALLESNRRCRRFRRRRARRTPHARAQCHTRSLRRWTCRAWRRRAQAGRPWGWTGTLQVEVGGILRGWWLGSALGGALERRRWHFERVGPPACHQGLTRVVVHLRGRRGERTGRQAGSGRAGRRCPTPCTSALAAGAYELFWEPAAARAALPRSSTGGRASRPRLLQLPLRCAATGDAGAVPP